MNNRDEKMKEENEKYVKTTDSIEEEPYSNLEDPLLYSPSQESMSLIPSS